MDDGVLRVEPGITLVLENNNCHGPLPIPACTNYDNSLIDGTLLLDWTSSDGGAVLRFTEEDHVLGGVGTLEGQRAAPGGSLDPSIEFAAGIKVTNQMDTDDKAIVGVLIFRSTPTGTAARIFRNEGLVHTNRGQITFESDIDLEDIEDARWMVEECRRMIFKREELSLEGDFVDATSQGIFEFQASISTCGAYVRDGGGGIDIVGAGVSFEYADFVSNKVPACANPDSTGTGGCSTPFEVTVDVSPDSCPGN